MPRCGACNKTFDKPKELMEHIKNDCDIATNTKDAIDVIIPAAEDRGIISIGIGEIDINDINESNKP